MSKTHTRRDFSRLFGIDVLLRHRWITSGMGLSHPPGWDNISPDVPIGGYSFLAHETAQTHRKSSSIRDGDLARGIHALPCKSKQSNAALIVGIVPLRRWPWRHNTNAIFPATIGYVLPSWSYHCIVKWALINILHNSDMKSNAVTSNFVISVVCFIVYCLKL